VTGTILRCNTRIELTVTEFLRLDRMRGAKRAPRPGCTASWSSGTTATMSRSPRTAKAR
jgi:hypothetical protein